MKNKLTIWLLCVNLIFALLPQGLCFAAQPTVSREYVSRRTDGIETTEETVNVNYKNLFIGSSDCMKISFLNADKEVLCEYDFGLYEDILQNEISFKSERFHGTEYIRIEMYCAENNPEIIEIPFEI